MKPSKCQYHSERKDRMHYKEMCHAYFLITTLIGLPSKGEKCKCHVTSDFSNKCLTY